MKNVIVLRSREIPVNYVVPNIVRGYVKSCVLSDPPTKKFAV